MKNARPDPLRRIEAALIERLDDHLAGYRPLRTAELLALHGIFAKTRPTADLVLLMVSNAYQFLLEGYAPAQQDAAQRDGIARFLKAFSDQMQADFARRTDTLKEAQTLAKLDAAEKA